MKPSMRRFLPKLSATLFCACLSSPAAAAIVNYNFTQNEHTHFTTGNYVVGTMTVNFDTNTITAVNLRLVSSTGTTLATFTTPVAYTAYTNTICGVVRDSYEASFNSGGYNLNLGFVPNSTSTPLPGDESGKHTSYWYGGVAYKLSSQCVQFNSAAPANTFPSNTTLAQSASNMNNTVALEAAAVLDEHPSLQNLFAQFNSDEERSNAISQTLPLFTGSTMISTYAVLTDMNRVIQSRISTNLGSSAKTEIGTLSNTQYTGNKDLWVRPFVSHMAQEDKHHISDFSTNTYGFVMGADTTLNPKFSLGGAFAYADTSIKSNSPITRQQADTSMFQLIVYGNYTLDDRTDATFHAGIGRNSTDAQRDLGFTAATPTASYNSISTHLGASIGRVYKLNDTYSVLPSVKLDHIWIKDDAYTEKGAGILSLLVDSHSVHALVTSVESKLFYQWNDKTTLSCSAGMGFDVLNQRNEVTAAYTGAPTSKFKTQGIKPNPWLVQGGVGIIHRYKNNIEISGRYDGEYRGSYTNHTGSIKLVWHF